MSWWRRQQPRPTKFVEAWAYTPADMQAAAARACAPRLRVWQSQYFDWWWRVTDREGRTLDRGVACSQPEALAVGLAALEQASARMST